MTINVARTEDEAERQARGEDVLAEADRGRGSRGRSGSQAEALFEEGAGPKEEEAEGETAEREETKAE